MYEIQILDKETGKALVWRTDDKAAILALDALLTDKLSDPTHAQFTHITEVLPEGPEYTTEYENPQPPL